MINSKHPLIHVIIMSQHQYIMLRHEAYYVVIMLRSCCNINVSCCDMNFIEIIMTAREITHANSSIFLIILAFTLLLYTLTSIFY